MPCRPFECYVVCPDLEAPSLSSLKAHGFGIAKLHRPWTNEEKYCLAQAIRAWQNDEAMARLGLDAKNNDPCLWIARHGLDNQRTPAEVRLAIKQLKSDIL